ncbi:MAG TPA: branched-chain amino acid ABC transporter permease [Euzebya sp.]|nr:branched-chain amino acid ABC transporter permease [Euzebya sp.]
MPNASDAASGDPSPAEDSVGGPADARTRARRAGHNLTPPGWAITAVVVIALVAAPWILTNSFLRFVATLTVMYMAMSMSWNIMGGMTGYISLGHSFFFGIGAYATGLMANEIGINPFLGSLLAGFLVAVIAAGVGFIALRVRGASFVIVTLSLVYIGSLGAQGWRSVTGGSRGLTLPTLDVGGALSHVPFYYAFALLLLVVLGLSAWLRRSRFGLALTAIREDEDKAEMLGIDTASTKLVAFVLSAVFVGIAGGLYAYWRVFLDPIFVFGIAVSVQMILIALIGGVRSLWGPVLGAVLFMPGSYYLLTTYPQWHLLLTGIVLGLVVLFLPDGIIPSVRHRLDRFGPQAASIREAAAGSGGGAGDVDSSQPMSSVRS